MVVGYLAGNVARVVGSRFRFVMAYGFIGGDGVIAKNDLTEARGSLQQQANEPDSGE